MYVRKINIFAIFTLLYQHQGVPEFGSWEEDKGAPLYTKYFENVRKGKSPGKSTSKNYKGHPQALSKDPPAKASPLRTGSDPVVQKTKDERRKNRGLSVASIGRVSSPWKNRGSSEEQAVPVFGEWEDMNVPSAERYSGIFNRVREEKSPGKAPEMITSRVGRKNNLVSPLQTYYPAADLNYLLI